MRPLLLALLLFVAGCSASLPPAPPAGDAVPALHAIATRTELVLSPDIYAPGDPWLKEARRRFKDPFLVYCHGGSDGYPTRWWLSPGRGHHDFATVESAAVLLHALMPDRDIVFICCDAAASPLNVPHCWHARRIVCSLPQSASWTPIRADWCASIDEFVCDAGNN